MKERIKKIMKINNMSSAQFADKIGVTRSSLSHVLSGRNKASLDYVMKILQSFPQIDSNWLLTGKDDGEFVSNNSIKKSDEPLDKLHNSLNNLNKKIANSKKGLIKEVLPKSLQLEDIEEDVPIVDQVRLNNTIESDIEKIVFFYRNGTFKVYQA